MKIYMKIIILQLVYFAFVVLFIGIGTHLKVDLLVILGAGMAMMGALVPYFMLEVNNEN